MGSLEATQQLGLALSQGLLTHGPGGEHWLSTGASVGAGTFHLVFPRSFPASSQHVDWVARGPGRSCKLFMT